MMRVFDADDEPGSAWLTATDAFAVALDQRLIPVAVPVRVDGSLSLATTSFAPLGRLGATARCADARVRARLAVGLVLVARERVRNDVGAGGVVPA